jgi:hypothetical protein
MLAGQFKRHAGHFPGLLRTAFLKPVWTWTPFASFFPEYSRALTYGLDMKYGLAMPASAIPFCITGVLT